MLLKHVKMKLGPGDPWGALKFICCMIILDSEQLSRTKITLLVDIGDVTSGIICILVKVTHHLTTESAKWTSPLV